MSRICGHVSAAWVDAGRELIAGEMKSWLKKKKKRVFTHRVDARARGVSIQPAAARGHVSHHGLFLSGALAVRFGAARQCVGRGSPSRQNEDSLTSRWEKKGGEKKK